MTLHTVVHPYILMDSMMALEAVKDSSALGNLTERSGSREKGRSAKTALAATADEDIYSREGILQDPDQFPYDFNLYTAHDLDSLENDFLLQL